MAKVFAEYTVVELAERRNQFIGKLMADAGARVIQVEPVEGSPGRRVGPFVDDEEDPDRSLDYWWYNTGKESVALDYTREPGKDLLRRLIAQADIFVESTEPGTLAKYGLDYDSVAATNPGLVYASLTDFGQSGPWVGLNMNDPAHLALGGQMGSSGYSDPNETPIGGQGRQAYNMASVMMLHSITIALFDRMMSGEGQYIDVAIHDCCAICTERPVSYWLWYNQPMVRQTGQHAGPNYGPPIQVQAGDGTYLNARFTFTDAIWPKMVTWMEELGVVGDLADERYAKAAARTEHAEHISEAVSALLQQVTGHEAFMRAQEMGLTWGLIRAPEENISLPHFDQRGFWVDVEHPEVGKTVPYPRGFYRSPELNMQPERRAPLLGEHTRQVLTAELGCDDAQFEALAQTGVVR